MTQMFTATLNMGIYFMTYILGNANLLGGFAWAINIPLIAEASEHTFLRSGKRIDGLMFSCTSLGVKIGSGLGTALAGWLLAASGYIANAPEQTGSVITMLYVMYLWISAVANAIILALLWRLDVEKANARLRTRAVDGGGEAPGARDGDDAGAGASTDTGAEV